MAERPAGPGVPEAWTGRLRGPEAQGTFFGDRDGAPVLVAFARSPMSDWTAVVEVPWTGETAPVRRTVRLLAAGGAALAIAAVALALLVARGADRPIQALRTFAAQARTRQREAETRYRTYWRHTGEALFVLSVEDGQVHLRGAEPGARAAEWPPLRFGRGPRAPGMPPVRGGGIADREMPALRRDRRRRCATRRRSTCRPAGATGRPAWRRCATRSAGASSGSWAARGT